MQNMSWFDAAGLANIAKSALKEAQRTIDKALDIKDDLMSEVNTRGEVNEDSSVHRPDNLEGNDDKNVPQGNIWGSFTGSFFDHSREYNKSVSLEGLDDSVDFNSQQFSQSKLVVDHNEGLENVKENTFSKTDQYVDIPATFHSSENETLTLEESNPVLNTKDLGDSASSSFFGNDEAIPVGHSPNINQESGKELSNSDLEKVRTRKNEECTTIEKLPQFEAITVPPSRNSNQLPMSNIVDDGILIDVQPQSSKEDISDILKSTNIIDIPLDDDSLKSSSENPLELSTDDGSQSDITIKGTEETQDNENLKNLLAEAIRDKDSVSGKTCTFSDSNSVQNDELSSENVSIIQIEMPPREYSPLSSDKSDLVKIGSSHTSGDELETATSSDIEIISSPNGDSSSTRSHHTPIKQCRRKIEIDQADSLLTKSTMKHLKGHSRELSEASSISDEFHSLEVDKLIRKIHEMTEILESRESKIIEMNRKNLELQEANIDLKGQLSNFISKQMESQDLTQVTEEYAQRMSALEKKFQQAIREKDALRNQLEVSKQEAATRLSKGELDSIINEKDEMIKQLREEGEKLSRQQLQHSNIIKKLRAKEKENETTIKQLKEKVEDFTTEVERLRRTVNAKEEVERSQIEAVNQLTSKNKKLENDLVKAQSELDDQIQKYETLKTSLDAARKELSDKNKITNQLTAKELMLESLENEKKVAESQNEEVINQLQYFRLKLHEYERTYSEKERNSRQENIELLKRLEDAECRNEELSQSVLEVSKPLIRQLESLQATHNMKMTHLEKIELELSSKINELQFKLNSSISSENSLKQETVMLRSKLANLQVDFSTVKHRRDILEVQLEQLNTEKTILQQELKGKVEELQSNLKMKCETIEELNQEISILNKAIEETNRKDSSPTSITQELEDMNEINSNLRNTSPTLSAGKASIADSLVSSVWSQIESIDIVHAPRYTNMFEIQMLQSNLQQREGELQQLQWELNRREQERNLINSELTSLTTKVEELMENQEDYENLKIQLANLQEQYDVLCQMYGEKVDEVEELKLDVLEAKEAYKSQLDELLRNQTTSAS